jgi:hypothetical protein
MVYGTVVQFVTEAAVPGSILSETFGDTIVWSQEEEGGT